MFQHLRELSPRFASVDTARHADAKRDREVCAAIQAGEIVIFDRGYVDFIHLADLSLREVFWVPRAKEGLKFKVFVRSRRRHDALKHQRPDEQKQEDQARRGGGIRHREQVH